ncbi:ANTAR domain-containing response regulator [Aneurinibacillus terranovensis]|uniref:ANTAR domain-containing response regulator n=1 Tax=Aneurinibacillus terranovensis TaxID=278991 RepID=UPI00041DF022|nr:response regulator [Aneurinibacillus terranovensis]
MSKGRIMVVDDESILRMDVKEMLVEAGYDVVAEANNGDMAIEQAAIHRPDLIVMDVKMPKMNGIKASRIIQKTYGIPVLLLTAYSEQELVQEAREAQNIGYLVKPITERDLIPSVEIALGQAMRINCLLDSIKKLEHQLEIRKKIEKAKGVLMAEYHLGEEEAYRKLRTYCMNNRISMDEAADHVIAHRSLKLDSLTS